jgi:hypothetical protein
MLDEAAKRNLEFFAVWEVTGNGHLPAEFDFLRWVGQPYPSPQDEFLPTDKFQVQTVAWRIAGGRPLARQSPCQAQAGKSPA